MITVTERVAAGAALLDQHDPGWWQQDAEDAINLDALDLSRGDTCILGQRCPVTLLAMHLGTEPGELDEGDLDLSYVALALYLGAKAERSYGSTRVDQWAAPLGFQAMETPGGGRDTDDYRALTAEWRRVIEARRTAA